MAEDRGLLPAFAEEGVLPPGDYPLTLEDHAASPLVGSPASPSDWDAAWRAELVGNLGILARQLWHAGIDAVSIDGSFVDDKAHPHEIGGYVDCEPRYLESGALERDLNALDPRKARTWHPQHRRWDPDSGKAQLPMWFAYHVERYPRVGQPTGIADRLGNQLQFPSAFRLSRRSYTPEGIMRLVRP